jgi:glucose/arabinose dehydrogenase
MRTRFLALAVALAGVATGSTALAAKGPPPPKTVGGQAASVVARGVPTPTAFAFGAGQTFVAGFGDEQNPKIEGGVYVLRAGKAVRLPGSPAHVLGLAYGNGTLYVSGGVRAAEIFAWSGWNGTRFTRARVVAGARKGFTGFNGIAMGSDGKLYAGVSLGGGKKDDHSKGRTLYANDVVAVDPKTGDIDVVASGMRQPWQPVFVPGHAGPLIADLGQENLGKKRPVDRIVEVEPGADFGFPSCPAKPAACSKYDEPFAEFPAHSSPMGLAALAGRLHVALFGGTGKGPEIVSMPLSGGKYTPELVGFAAPVVALASHGGRLYAGDLTGSIYRFRP